MATRRDRFLAEFEAALAQLARDFQLVKVATWTLRTYVAQRCLGLSKEGIEEGVCESRAIRRFVGIDLGTEPAPDATTLLKFRCSPERQRLTKRAFEAANTALAERSLLIPKGTAVDVTLVATVPSFRMPAHVRRDGAVRTVRSRVGPADQAVEVTHAHQLLLG